MHPFSPETEDTFSPAGFGPGLGGPVYKAGCPGWISSSEVILFIINTLLAQFSSDMLTVAVTFLGVPGHPISLCPCFLMYSPASYKRIRWFALCCSPSGTYNAAVLLQWLGTGALTSTSSIPQCSLKFFHLLIPLILQHICLSKTEVVSHAQRKVIGTMKKTEGYSRAEKHPLGFAFLLLWSQHQANLQIFILPIPASIWVCNICFSWTFVLVTLHCTNSSGKQKQEYGQSYFL